MVSRLDSFTAGSLTVLILLLVLFFIVNVIVHAIAAKKNAKNVESYTTYQQTSKSHMFFTDTGDSVTVENKRQLKGFRDGLEFVLPNDPKLKLFTIMSIAACIIVVIMVPLRFCIEYDLILSNIDSVLIECVYELIISVSFSIALIVISIQIYHIYFKFYLQLCIINHMSNMSINETAGDWFWKNQDTFGNLSWLLHYWLNKFRFIFVLQFIVCITVIVLHFFSEIDSKHIRMINILSHGLTLILFGFCIYRALITIYRTKLFGGGIKSTQIKLVLKIAVLLLYGMLLLWTGVLDFIFEDSSLRITNLILLCLFWNVWYVIVDIDPMGFTYWNESTDKIREFEEKSGNETKQKGKESTKDHEISAMTNSWTRFIQTQEGYILFMKYLATADCVENLMFMTEWIQIKPVYRHRHGNMLQLPTSELREAIFGSYSDHDSVFRDKLQPDVDEARRQYERKLHDGIAFHVNMPEKWKEKISKLLKDEWNGNNYDNSKQYIIFEFDEVAKMEPIQSESAISFILDMNMSALQATKMVKQQKSNQTNQVSNNNDTKENDDFESKEEKADGNMSIGIDDGFKEASVGLDDQDIQIYSADIVNDHNTGQLVILSNQLQQTGQEKGTASSGAHHLSLHGKSVSFGKQETFNSSVGNELGHLSKHSSNLQLPNAYGVESGVVGHKSVMSQASVPWDAIQSQIHSIATFSDYENVLEMDREHQLIGYRAMNGKLPKSHYHRPNNVRPKTVAIMQSASTVSFRIYVLPSGIPASKELVNNVTLYDQMAALYKKYILVKKTQVNINGKSKEILKNFFSNNAKHAKNILQIQDASSNPAMLRKLTPENVNKNKKDDNDDDDDAGAPLTTSHPENVPVFLYEYLQELERKKQQQGSNEPTNDQLKVNNNNNGGNDSKDFRILAKILEYDNIIVKNIKPTKATDVYISKLNRMAFHIFDNMIADIHVNLQGKFIDFKRTRAYKDYCTYLIDNYSSFKDDIQFAKKWKNVKQNKPFNPVNIPSFKGSNTVELHKSTK